MPAMPEAYEPASVEDNESLVDLLALRVRPHDVLGREGCAMSVMWLLVITAFFVPVVVLLAFLFSLLG